MEAFKHCKPLISIDGNKELTDDCATYFHLGELFARKGLEANAQLQAGEEVSQVLIKAIEFNSKHMNTMNVCLFDRWRSKSTVEECASLPGQRAQTYDVHFQEGRCGCRYFGSLSFLPPCVGSLFPCQT
ncbi:hypothetical protein PIB30_050216 [Stylosanthes scabra]|uniref:Uncharacterized protein n=1 Tax=Stylosanthes scabra TaxID=79078 RepID=A0ABU6WFS8_9FABA|nr:hypothetical protein [Stylosanthes scabra]